MMKKKYSAIILCVLLVVPALFGCTTKKEPPAAAQLKICRAALAALTGASVRDIRAQPAKDGDWAVHAWQTDAANTTIRGILCKFDGDKIVWSNAEKPSSPEVEGRWKMDPNVEKLRYATSGDTVTITVTHQNATEEGKIFTVK